MSSNYLINPLSVSPESISNDLKLLISRNPDAFKDFYNTGAGSAVIDMAAALGAFYAFHSITQRRELSLTFAESYSNLIGTAEGYGYSAYRGSNVKVRLRVKPNYSLAVSKWTVIGNYLDYDITLLSDVIFNKDVPVDIDVVIGNQLTESQTVMTSAINVFKFVNDKVTEDMRVLLNDSEVPYTNTLREMINDKYSALSNSYGSVDVMYLQNGKYTYKPSDILAVNFIERNNIAWAAVTQDSFYISNTEIQSISLISDLEDKEVKSSMRVKAALHNETSGVIKARADYRKEILSSLNFLKSGKDIDINPGLIAIAFLKKNYEPLTEEDEQEIENVIKPITTSGVARIVLAASKENHKKIIVEITRKEGAYIDASIVTEVKNLIANYEYELETSLDLDALENEIEKIEGVKIARVLFDTQYWEASKSYRITDSAIATSFNNKSYYVDQIINKTGETPPTWSDDFDTYIEDGRVLWKRYNGSPTGIMLWSAGMEPLIYSFVTDSADENRRVYQCVGYVNKSGSVAPNWLESGDVVIDHEVVWKKIASSSKASVYNTNRFYLINDEMYVTVNTGSEEEPKNEVWYYRCIDYAAISGEEEPTWNSSDKTLDGERLVWVESTYPLNKVVAQWDTYFVIDSDVKII